MDWIEYIICVAKKANVYGYKDVLRIQIDISIFLLNQNNCLTNRKMKKIYTAVNQ